MYKSLLQRKTRTWLTTLSILIGIMAIFALVSFGDGLTKYMDDLSDEMGADKIVIQPITAGMAIPDSAITADEVDFIRGIKGIKEAEGMIIQSVKIQPDKNTKARYAYLMSASVEKESRDLIEELLTVDILEGRNLRKGDKMKAVLGYNYLDPERVFEKPLSVGQKILLNDKQVEIVGFYNSLGNPNDDMNVYVTLEGVEEILGIKDEFEWVVARTEAGVDPTALSEKVKDKFRRYRGLDKGKENFFVQSFEEMIASFSNVIDVLNNILLIIALISVVISAINIMNTMYTSVLERTKDIGIMKAIGAKNKDITTIFLVESGLLGLVGGIIGVLLGWGVSSMGGAIAANAGFGMLQPYFSPWLVVGCLVFSTLIGGLSGLAPAIQASRQKPVDSLRYE